MKIVTSLTNETVKAVRALHLKKAREESGLFLAEGLKIVAEAVDQGHAPAILLYSSKASDQPMLARVAAAAREVIEVTPAVLAKISRRDNPQTVLGVFEQSYAPLAEMSRDGLLLGLEEIRDPGNLGTILRTADAAGCAGVILIGETCDPFSVEAVRATMGSIFATPIARASAAEFLAWRAGWPGSVVGTLLTASTDFRAFAYPPASLILLGNEQAGLTPELAAACDVTVKIPMRGGADSLNLAVAAAVMIYAATGD
ncbi:MAG TPA: RNA methyltransferase [Caulobacteraceae bacterium]